MNELAFTDGDFENWAGMDGSFECKLHELGIFPRSKMPMVLNTKPTLNMVLLNPLECVKAKNLVALRFAGVEMLRALDIPLMEWTTVYHYTIAELCDLGFEAHDFDHWKDATNGELQQLLACRVLVDE